MDGKDVLTRLSQNIVFLKNRSGSGQVPPEELCRVLEEQAYFIAEAYGLAKDASDMAKGVMAKIQALEQRLVTQGAGGAAGTGGLGGAGVAQLSGRLPPDGG